MYLYEVEYVPSNGGRTLPLQGQRHSIQVTVSKVENGIFLVITGPHFLSIQHYLGGRF